MPSNDRADRIGVELARILREERERKGASMTGLGERAGLSQQMISYIERGLRKPTLDTLIRITDALEVDLPRLIQSAIDRTHG